NLTIDPNAPESQPLQAAPELPPLGPPIDVGPGRIPGVPGAPLDPTQLQRGTQLDDGTIVPAAAFDPYSGPPIGQGASLQGALSAFNLPPPGLSLSPTAENVNQLLNDIMAANRGDFAPITMPESGMLAPPGMGVAPGSGQLTPDQWMNLQA